ncbi:MAG TPA: AAA family ATPase [Gaiellaceae bacterium]
MHLKTIKLRGFKSFVDPVEVRLEPGVAVVVGPNGSGKSNISDAILWATGSLSPHELRAEKPDDILFAGSAGRKPADFCEVELIFDNEDGAWPDLPFAEVSLARRLHRGGEGQYLVNRAAVRRIDLIELLSDVGLGGGLRSIISQGSVETVLGAKPAERRSLVEEAAGLGRFKLRRHRAELKLARVTTQVERAQDVESEVRKRLRPLALQATAAERAAKLAEEAAALQAALATIDLAQLEQRRTTTMARRESEQAARSEHDAKTQALVAERAAAEEELTDAAGAREATTAALYRLRSEGERLTLRKETAATLARRFATELEAAEAFDPARTDDLLAAAREAAAAAQAAVAERTAAHLRAEERWALLAGVEWKRHSAIAAELEELAGERSLIERDLVGGGRDSLLALRDAAQRVGHRQESIARRRAELGAELVEANRGGPTPRELGRAADEADSLARTAARERDDLQARLQLARQRLASLDQSLAEREGLAPAARALAEGGERLALSTLDVAPGEERAVAAALGRLASAIVTDDPARGLELVREIQAGGLGPLVVLVGRDPAQIVAGVPVLELDDLLASTVPAVTRQGIGWDPVRGELWFAGETAEALMLELEARRRDHVSELEKLADAAEAASTAAAEAAERSRGAAEAFAPVAHLRARPQRDPRLLTRIAHGAERLDEALRVAAVVAARLEEPLSVRVEQAAGSLGVLAARELELRRATSELDGRARAAERRAGGRVLDGSVGEPDDLRQEAEQLSALAVEAAAAATAASERSSAASRALADAGTEDSKRISRIVLERLSALSSRLERSLTVDVAASESALRRRVDADAARTSELGATLRRLGAEEVELRALAGAAVERLSASDVELARIGAERDEAARRLEAAGAEPAEGENRAELADRLARIERRREQIGQVNPLAKEEYDAEKERLDELTVQREDLEKSLSELEKLRRDLTETVETRFAETFAAVEKHFHEVAGGLFPGGEGRLTLTDPEDEEGEPGIEVELRPAGKRVTRLSLLSGGEKSLGAIAFLFALFLARPSPFYLLDEVEAALDDTNIGRFTNLLRTYADRAQFIVVTHQKRTMEAADILYGVTMGTEGISQILSRRLPHDVPAAASA